MNGLGSKTPREAVKVTRPPGEGDPSHPMNQTSCYSQSVFHRSGSVAGPGRGYKEARGGFISKTAEMWGWGGLFPFISE